MSFNALDIYLKEKKAFLAQRGAEGASSLGKAIPATTWRDVYRFGTAFLEKCTNKGFLECCMENQLNPLINSYTLEAKCGGLIVQTDAYKRAWNNFAKQQPLVRAIGKWGTLGPAYMAAKAAVDEPYPWNTDFWESANRFAIGRNAAGEVEDNWSMAMWAIADSAKNLPNTIAGGVNYAIDVSGAKSFLKKLALYGAVGFGIYILGPPLLQSLTRKKGK